MTLQAEAYGVLQRHFGTDDADFLAEAFDEWLCRLESRCLRIARHGQWYPANIRAVPRMRELSWEPVWIRERETLRALLIRHFGASDAGMLFEHYADWMSRFEQSCFLAAQRGETSARERLAQWIEATP